MTIHKEGHRILIITFIFLLGGNAYIYNFHPDLNIINQALAGGSVVLFLLVLQFFRNPKRSVNAKPNEVIAPADGKIVVIERTKEDEFLKDERIQISIFMSPLNVHVCRAPIGGVVKFFKYHAGKYLVAWHPKSSTENERTTMVIENNSGVQVLVRQIAGAVARRIKWYVSDEEFVDPGQEYGFIKFGSRLDVFLPLDADIKVSTDQKTTGGKTVLAELK